MGSAVDEIMGMFYCFVERFPSVCKLWFSAKIDILNWRGYDLFLFTKDVTLVRLCTLRFLWSTPMTETINVDQGIRWIIIISQGEVVIGYSTIDSKLMLPLPFKSTDIITKFDSSRAPFSAVGGVAASL